MQLACEKSVGGMAAIIGEERARVAELCAEFGIEAANFNAPGQIIVSGEKPKVDALVAAAKDKGLKRVMALNVAGAYHSRLMEPARAAFAAHLAGVISTAAVYRFQQHHRPGRQRAGADPRSPGEAGRVVGPVGRLHARLRAAGATEFWSAVRAACSPAWRGAPRRRGS